MQAFSSLSDLPLISGCIGQCEYCYLNTNLGDKPLYKVNVNIDDILYKAKEYINERLPETTIFRRICHFRSYSY